MKKNNISFKRDTFKLTLLKNLKLEGQYQFPIVKGTNKILSKYEVIPFNLATSIENKQKYFVHFYIDDYQFDRIWNYPEKYLELLKQFKGCIAPDFSMYIDMPKSMQIYNCFKSRVLSAYWQENGILVIPNATWSDFNSFEYCFDSLPKNSTIAVSSVGCIKNSKALLKFCEGFLEMKKRLSPTHILFYGEIPESLKDDKKIIQIATHMQIKIKGVI